MIIHLFKVTEHSLTPEIQEGDFVLTLNISFVHSHYKAGDIVVFSHPHYGRMIKRVQTVSQVDNSLFVIGSHPNSIDSRRFGPIKVESVIGKVIWHIPKQGSS